MKYFNIKRMFSAISYITIGIAIIISASLLVQWISEGCNQDFSIPWYYFPGMVGVGIVCGFFTEFILPNKEVNKKEEIIRFGIHGCFMIIAVWMIGYMLHWFSTGLVGFVSVIVNVAIVYGFVFLMMKKKNEKIADELNKGLEEYMRKEKP